MTRMRTRPALGPLLLVAGLLTGGISLVAPVGGSELASSGLTAGYTAYVAVTNGTVTPIDTATNVGGSPITAGASTGDGAYVAITPDGSTAYYADEDGNTVTPINTATDTADSPISLPSGSYPDGIAAAPNGKTVYVSVYNNQVVPISTSTNQPGTPIAMPTGCVPYDIAIAPDGETAYVVCVFLEEIVPIDLTTNPPSVGTPIGGIGNDPYALAIAPNGKTAYVSDDDASDVTPVDLVTDAAEAPISVGQGPAGIAITPNGEMAYVADSGNGGNSSTPDGVTPINLATDTPETFINLGTQQFPYGVTITPDGKTAYVAEADTDVVAQISLVTDTVVGTIPAGANPFTVAITPDQAPTASFTYGAGSPNSASTFDASASSAPVGSIVSYAWNFGDGTSTVVTTTPDIDHVYSDAGEFTVSLTVTDSAGTSTAQVFTGKTVSLNGGPSAEKSHTVTISAGGYRLAGGDGGVFSFGTQYLGSASNLQLRAPIVAIACTASGSGYWIVGRDGGVFSYGNASFDGSLPALGVDVSDVVGVAADPATGGYWLAASDGGVFSFDAPFHGSLPARGIHVDDIVGIAVTPDGGGYRLVASDGAVYQFGNATNKGEASSLAHLNAPVVGIATDAGTGGYWEAASDGGVFAYGAPFQGSASAFRLDKPVVGIAVSSGGSGYLLVAADGGVFAFGSPFRGSMAGRTLSVPVSGVAAS